MSVPRGLLISASIWPIRLLRRLAPGCDSPTPRLLPRRRLVRSSCLPPIWPHHPPSSRPGQRFAFVMDTRLCDAAFALADRADMLVCESTFADAEAGLARDYGHLTAGQAGQIAAQSGARLLVLTHFSQRYEAGDGERLAGEAASAFGGEVVLARDLDHIPVPRRRTAAAR